MRLRPGAPANVATQRMNHLRFSPRDLMTRLALLYAVLALIALVLVKWTLLLSEFSELKDEIARGSLITSMSAEALDLSQDFDTTSAPSTRSLEHALESFLLHLERPRDRLGDEPSFILTELAAQPLAAAIVDPNGVLLASAPGDGKWQAQIAPGGDPLWQKLSIGDAPTLVASDDSPRLLRRYVAPIRDSAHVLRGALVLELRLPVPWRTLSFDWNFEWPILIAYLLLFGLGSALFLSRYVTRRLNRIASAAHAWSGGDFSEIIQDQSADELGVLARDLNRMASELRALVQTRARLASIEERQRLARDLHDTVKQKAFALQLQLAAAARHAEPGDRTRIEEARRITEEIQRELMLILDKMRLPENSAGAAGTLEAQIAERSDAWARRSGIALHRLIDDAREVSAAHNEAVLRIIDEALANVWRHSNANEARLSLQHEENQFTLRIVDNGCGGATERSAGMGIHNMRERSAGLPSGRFALSSSTDGGTMITVCWSVSIQ